MSYPTLVIGLTVCYPMHPPQKSIDIEDDWDEVEDTYDETDDSVMTRGKRIQRNEWGLPVVDEEE